MSKSVEGRGRYIHPPKGYHWETGKSVDSWNEDEMRVALVEIKSDDRKFVDLLQDATEDQLVEVFIELGFTFNDTP